jgi:hypothetical protein
MAGLPHPHSNASRSDQSWLDGAADQAIAMASGDMRSAIRSLILANEYLEMELSEVYAAVSKGYTRGEVWREPPKANENRRSRR